MMFQKKWNFGLGTIFSLIVIYFIFLYSRDKGWSMLAFLSKWYLIIVGGAIALSVGVILLVILLSILLFLGALVRASLSGRKKKKQNNNSAIDIEYKVKD